jgi:hypothetical protein
MTSDVIFGAKNCIFIQKTTKKQKNMDYIDILAHSANEIGIMLTGVIVSWLHSHFQTYTKDNYPTDVNEAEAMQRYGSTKYDYWAFVPIFVFTPCLAYLLGSLLLYARSFVPIPADATVIYVSTGFYYLISALIVFGFIMNIGGWFYELVLGKQGYKMYCVAYSVRFKVNYFAMQKSYYKFTIFMFITAFIALVLFNGMHVKTYDTHVEVQHFYKISPRKWEYTEIRSIEYATTYHYYKVKTKDGDFFTTGFYDQNTPEKIPQMIAFIAEKAKIKIDTVADYSKE